MAQICLGHASQDVKAGVKGGKCFCSWIFLSAGVVNCRFLERIVTRAY
jgi:hypothetical protein